MKKQAFNPYLPSWEYIPDGEPYVFGDRVYVYGSHDLFNGYVYCMGDYVCWSAPVNDLGDWRYEGVIYPKTADPMNTDGKMNLYAPDVTVGPDGRYYLYYVLDKAKVVSVAVCDTPAGDYQFYGYVHYQDGTRLGEREGDEPQFDPGLLTEGDTTYLYTGFAGQYNKSRHGAMVTVLTRDMLTIQKDPVFIVPGNAYSEGTEFDGTTSGEITRFVLTGRRMLFDRIKFQDPNERDITMLPFMPQLRTVRRIVGAEDFNAIPGQRCERSVGSCGDFRPDGKGKHYHIPFGTLYNAAYPNLLAAGRMISAPQGDGWEVARVIPNCALAGQAAGTAAALTVQRKSDIPSLPYSALRKALEDGGVLFIN